MKKDAKTLMHWFILLLNSFWHLPTQKQAFANICQMLIWCLLAACLEYKAVNKRLQCSYSVCVQIRQEAECTNIDAKTTLRGNMIIISSNKLECKSHHPNRNQTFFDCSFNVCLQTNTEQHLQTPYKTAPPKH